MIALIQKIVFFTLLPFVFIGCQFQPGHKSYAYAEELLSKGELTEASEVAKEILKSYTLSTQERSKLDSVLEISSRIRKDFTLSDSDILRKLVKYHPDITREELLQLENEHKLDVRLLDGEKRYFKNCVSNLFRLDTTYARLRNQIDGIVADTFPAFKRAHSATVIRESGVSGQPVHPVRMKLTYTIRVHADAVPAGEVIRCWMPYPRETNPRQRDIRLIKTDPESHQVSPTSDLQRTVYLEKKAVANQPTLFQTEIELTSFAQSFQLTPEMVKPYNKTSAIYKEFTAERPPQIVFNKKIKSLVKYILQEETNPLLQVRKIYRWINDSVTWASALEYCIMPDIPGFVTETRHGDCGMQTLLFMTLARSAGIPVKWQSGWMLHPGEVNLHDWCEVWYEGIGWVPLDQSFGLQDSPDPGIRDFYTTGIDAYRLIVNDDYGRALTPRKKYFRSEPYDFQRGELEWKEGNLYFDKWSWHMEVSYQ